VNPDLGDLPGGGLLADGVITAVGQGLSPASAGAEVIDAAGRLVIPGISLKYSPDDVYAGTL
jgi:N-acyl-D-aspartate/D-glutamate deacylase